jgi:hypothetical protein
VRTVYRQPKQIQPLLQHPPQLQREETEPDLSATVICQQTQDNGQILSKTPTKPVLTGPPITRQFGGFFEIKDSTIIFH